VRSMDRQAGVVVVVAEGDLIVIGRGVVDVAVAAVGQIVKRDR